MRGSAPLLLAALLFAAHCALALQAAPRSAGTYVPGSMLLMEWNHDSSNVTLIDGATGQNYTYRYPKGFPIAFLGSVSYEDHVVAVVGNEGLVADNTIYFDFLKYGPKRAPAAFLPGFPCKITTNPGPDFAKVSPFYSGGRPYAFVNDSVYSLGTPLPDGTCDMQRAGGPLPFNVTGAVYTPTSNVANNTVVVADGEHVVTVTTDPKDGSVTVKTAAAPTAGVKDQQMSFTGIQRDPATGDLYFVSQVDVAEGTVQFYWYRSEGSGAEGVLWSKWDPPYYYMNSQLDWRYETASTPLPIYCGVRGPYAPMTCQDGENYIWTSQQNFMDGNVPLYDPTCQ